MTLHPRTKQTNAARFAIADAVRVAAELHDLTYAEVLYILGQESSAWSAMALRAERSDTPLAQPVSFEAPSTHLHDKGFDEDYQSISRLRRSAEKDDAGELFKRGSRLVEAARQEKGNV
jgi:hypothetical protein